MGLRVRRSIKVVPGVRLNLTQKGISSLSIGKRGATINVNRQGVQASLGVPGTGVSYRTKRKKLK